MNENNLYSLKGLFSSDKAKKIIVILGLVGIALIFFSTLTDTSSSKNSDNEFKTATSDFDTDAYRIELESRLADIISHIDGAGNTGVMITLEGSREYIYAQDKQGQEDAQDENKSVSEKSEYVLKKLEDGSEEPIIIRENEPRVRGVIVVCSGGGNNAVKEKVIEAVTSVFNITPSRVSVNKISN